MPANNPEIPRSSSPNSVEKEKEELVSAISTVARVMANWSFIRHNPGTLRDHKTGLPLKSETELDAAFDADYKHQKEAIETIRELVRSGVDRWISPALGTPPGKWTTDLLSILRTIEHHLQCLAPIRVPERAIFKVAWRPQYAMHLAEEESIILPTIGQLQKLSFQAWDIDISAFSVETISSPVRIRQLRGSEGDGERILLRVDHGKLQVFWGDLPLEINAGHDFKTCRALIEANGNIVPHGDLLRAIKPGDIQPGVVQTEASPEIKDAVSHIRGALEKVECPFEIKPVKAKGYKLQF